MNYRRFGRTGWQVSEVGYGMWGMGGWTGSDDDESRRSLDKSVEGGCNFFDTALVYGDGHSERLLGELLRRHEGERLYVASKIPPKNMQWPSRHDSIIEETFPPKHIRECTERSLENLGIDSIDLMQFHVWEDAWDDDDEWKEAIEALRDEGVVRAWGISINRWQPWNVIKTLNCGLIDAVQVIYNIFDQSPEDELFPTCLDLDIAVLARVPFDEGSLTGKLAKDTTWPEGDFRNSYFSKGNLEESVERAGALRELLPEGMDMAETALRFILSHRAVSTVIPGMRKTRHVEANLAAGDGKGLGQEVVAALRAHRWDRGGD